MVSSIGMNTTSSMMQRFNPSQKPARAGASGDGAAPPAAGGGAPPPPVVGSTGQTSSTTKTFDPADTNQDGTVSAQELLAYLSLQASKSASASLNPSSDASVMQQTLLHAYGNSSQVASPPVGATLSVTA